MKDVNLINDCDVSGGCIPLPNFRRFYRIEFDKPVSLCQIVDGGRFTIVSLRDRTFIDLSGGELSTVEGGNLTLYYEPKTEPRRITFYMRATIIESSGNG